MDIIYKSTRGDAKEYKASAAVIKGIADDGGLFVPDRIPKIFLLGLFLYLLFIIVEHIL